MSEKGSRKKGKVKIASELCKTCGYCAEHCPTECISFSSQYNLKGYYPAQWSKEKCTGCALCAVVCPEAAIEVWRE